MSEGAYGVASFLDPETRFNTASHIRSNIEEVPHVQPVAYPEDIPPGIDPASYQPAWEMTSQMHDMKQLTEGMQMELQGMKEELKMRGQVLIDTRSQLHKVEHDVATMRADLRQWQLSMKQIHQQIKQRDAKRLAALTQLSRMISQQAAQARTR